MEVIQCHEGFKVIDGKFSYHCMKAIVRMNNELYLASWKPRRHDGIDPSELFDVHVLQTSNRGPELQQSWRVVEPDPDHHVKKPKLSDYASNELEVQMQREIETWEMLQDHPHPNIALYYGCYKKNARATALAFKKYKATLSETVNPQGLNKHQFMTSGRALVSKEILVQLGAIRGALDHLHNSLNCAHNDINPSNIMLDQDGMLVIIDFGSCRAVGESLQVTGTARTHGWHNPQVDQSSAENDIQALEELIVWLSGSADQLHW